MIQLYKNNFKDLAACQVAKYKNNGMPPVYINATKNAPFSPFKSFFSFEDHKS